MQFPWTKKTAPALSVAPAGAPQTVHAPCDELEILQTEITLDQSVLSGLEAEAREAGNQLAELGQRTSQLKVKISEGSLNASMELDALENEQRASTRRHEGLRLRIETLQTAIAPKLRRGAELAQEADAIRQNEIVSDLTAKAGCMTAELLENWRHACAVGYDLMTLLNEGMSGQIPLDEEHKRQILGVNLNVSKALLHASLEHVNAHWAFARPDGFHSLKVLPGRPREQIAKAG